VRAALLVVVSMLPPLLLPLLFLPLLLLVLLLPLRVLGPAPPPHCGSKGSIKSGSDTRST
jgi:hypothetical protein